MPRPSRRCFVRQRTGRHVGGSTGTNMWGVFHLIDEMRRHGETGSVVTLICDGGERYANTYDDDSWVAEQGMNLPPYLEAMQTFLDGGPWAEP